MNEITTKKDVNEILADSKSLTQYLEDVYEVEKNLYSVYQAKQRMEVIINQSGQERVMERKCPSLLHIGNILLTVAALYCGGRILLSEGMWTAIFIVFTIGAVWWLTENVKSYVHQKKAYDENVKAVAADRKRVQEELESLPEKRQILAECTRSVEESQQLLDKLYELNVIFPKYRDLVAVSQMYEYVASGRCNTLSGYEGAYNLYEQELRMNIVISQLEDIYDQLEEISTNQYMLYSAICESNNLLLEVANYTEMTAYNKGVIMLNSNIYGRYF